jgi:hypothetical protein
VKRRHCDKRDSITMSAGHGNRALESFRTDFHRSIYVSRMSKSQSGMGHYEEWKAEKVPSYRPTHDDMTLSATMHRPHPTMLGALLGRSLQV